MTATDTRVRSVLAAPRGHRFSRPGVASGRPRVRHTAPESPEARRERLLRQMEGNPRVAYMLEHGELPHWMHVARQHREQAEREAREARQAVESPPQPPNIARGRHRAPRHWKDWPAVAVSAALLLGLAVAESIGQEVFRAAGLL